MKILYSILKSLFVSLLPIIIIIYSLAYTSIDSKTYLDTFQDNNFYEELTNEFKFFEIDNINKKSGSQIASYLIIKSLSENIADKSWVENITRENILIFTNWLKGEENILIFYIPTGEIENVSENALDSQTNLFLEENADKIRTCSTEEAQNIKNLGFNEVSFCLPQEIKNGEVNLTEFLKQNRGENILDNLFDNNIINNQSERFRAATFAGEGSAASSFYNILSDARNLFVEIRNYIWVAFSVILIWLIVLGFIGKTERKSLYFEFKKICWRIGFLTVSTSLILILTIGGFSYFNSWIITIFMPWFESQSLSQILFKNIFWITFKLLTPALIIGISLIIVSIIATLLDMAGIIRNPKKLNSEIKEHNKTNYQPELTNTFDGEFQKRVKEDFTKQKIYLNDDFTNIQNYENDKNDDFYINTPIKKD